MTPKQAERLQLKIKQIKAALAADKRRWGGFHHDGKGLRYLPPALYIKLGDYTGGLRYLNWFAKNFPDDIGFPDFLFEGTVILFKTGRFKEAEKMAWQTFCGNTYLFDKFFGRPVVPIDKYECMNLEKADYVEQYFTYSHQQADLKDFAAWLEQLTGSASFSTSADLYIDLHKQINGEADMDARQALLEKIRQLEKEG